MKIVAIKERADGNETVGSVWVETAIFEETDKLGAVLDWAKSKSGYAPGLKDSTRHGRLILSVVDHDQTELAKEYR